MRFIVPGISFLLVSAFAAGAGAKPVLGDGTIDRPTQHSVWWCPSEVYLSLPFTADGPEITLEFVARVHWEDPPHSWMSQRIDNVAVVEQGVYDAHSGVVHENIATLPCSSTGAETFYFHTTDAEDIVFLDQFAAGVDAGWDQTHGAYFVDAGYSSRSAPNNPEFPEANPTGGSLGLGTDAFADPEARTSITIGGLTAGTHYVLSFWWKCNSDVEVMDSDLEVTIYGTEFWTDVTSFVFGGARTSRGLAWGDYDNDGDADLYATNGAASRRLLRNDGGGVFADATAGPLAGAGAGQGAAWADFDNDGWLDLFLTNSGQTNKLFRNGSAGFTDVTNGALVGAPGGKGIAWLDYDNDGRVDLYVANALGANQLLRNTSAGFVDVTTGPLGDLGDGSSVACADYDGDGDQDIYLTNVSQPCKLLRNDGSRGFTDVTTASLAGPGSAAGAAWADYDNDGDPDLVVAAVNPRAYLLRNNGTGHFTNVTAGPLSGVGASQGVAWADVENDGDLDLYLSSYGQASHLFLNQGSGSFVDAQSEPLSISGNGQGAAFADYDGDGDPDLYLANYGESGRLFRKDFPGGHWLQLDLRGVQSNRSAIGARVQLTAGGKTQVREVSGGSGYMSQNALRVSFGLGSATQADILKVFWPSGVVQETLFVAADQRIGLIERATQLGVPTVPRQAAFRLGPNRPNPFVGSTSISYELSETLPVSIRIFDLAGRFIREISGGVQAAGAYSVSWDGMNGAGEMIPTGIYVYQLEASGFRQARKMVLIRRSSGAR